MQTCVDWGRTQQECHLALEACPYEVNPFFAWQPLRAATCGLAAPSGVPAGSARAYELASRATSIGFTASTNTEAPSSAVRNACVSEPAKNSRVNVPEMPIFTDYGTNLVGGICGGKLLFRSVMKTLDAREGHHGNLSVHASQDHTQCASKRNRM